MWKRLDMMRPSIVRRLLGANIEPRQAYVATSQMTGALRKTRKSAGFGGYFFLGWSFVSNR
jgi:hypothetical protein